MSCYLDEAGNNLDIPTLTILEDYLNSFSGIVIAVSHDRYFLDNIADRLLELDGEGHVTQYEGGYTDYLEAKKRRMSIHGEQRGICTAQRKNPGRKRIRLQSGSVPGGAAQSMRKSGKSWKQDRPQKLKLLL